MYNLFFQEAVVSIEIIEGQLLVKDQIREYMDQGSQLEHWSYLDYFLGTYDGKSSKKPLPFMVTHPAFRSPIVMTDEAGHCQIFHAPGHETMPFFPGHWFPKKDPSNLNGLFEASIVKGFTPLYLT